MKKFTVLTLFGLLILVFSATVHAQQLEFKASGYYSVTTYAFQNIPSTGELQPITGFFSAPFAPPGTGVANSASGAWNRTQSFLESRMALNFDAIMGKELSARTSFEMDALRWGSNPNVAVAASQGGNNGIWRTDATSVEIKHLYMDIGLPFFGIPIPMTVRVGQQPLGVRPHILMITDGSGVTGGLKLDPVTIAPMWAKQLEGRDAAADDIDFYGLHVNAKLGSLTVGGYGLYFNMNTYPGYNVQTTYGITPTHKADFWWFGGYVDGKVGPVNIQTDLIYDWGKVKPRDSNPGSIVKYSGYVGRAKVDYPWEKFNFGVVGVYGSGSDLKKTGTQGLPGETVANSVAAPGATTSKVNSFVVTPGSETAAITGDDFFIFGNFVTLEVAPLNYAPASPTLTHTVHRGAYGGLWFAKLFAGYKVTPWYKINLEALYLGDTTTHGNTLGNAVKSNGALRDDSGIGWEFNLINDINIYKNLVWNIGAGYLIGGDALDQRVGTTTQNKAPHNPWIVATKLRYTF